MAIVASFTVSQSAVTPQNVTIEDTSTGTYDTIVSRRLYLSTATGEYLTGNGSVNYDTWALADLTYTFTGLTEDVAANIRVDWVDANGDVVDTLNNNYPLSEFGKQFLFYLVQLQGLTPGIYQDANYSGNLALFWTNIIAGDNAVTYGNDLSGAQNCYNRETLMRQNQAYYFGTPVS